MYTPILSVSQSIGHRALCCVMSLPAITRVELRRRVTRVPDPYSVPVRGGQDLLLTLAAAAASAAVRSRRKARFCGYRMHFQNPTMSATIYSPRAVHVPIKCNYFIFFFLYAFQSIFSPVYRKIPRRVEFQTLTRICGYCGFRKTT